jgi:hypothetical protein
MAAGAAIHDDYHRSLAEHRDVRVVRDEDVLPRGFHAVQVRDDRLEDEPVIEIVLGLVDEQRVLTFEQQDREDRGAFLTGRKRRRILVGAAIE